MLPANSSTAPFPGTNLTAPSAELIPHLRFRGISYIEVPKDIVVPIPDSWSGKALRLEIKAHNMTHYSMSTGPADALSQMKTILDVSNAPVSWGFSGKSLRVFLLLGANMVQVLSSVFIVQATATREAHQLISLSGDTPHRDNSGIELSSRVLLPSYISHSIIYKTAALKKHYNLLPCLHLNDFTTSPAIMSNLNFFV